MKKELPNDKNLSHRLTAYATTAGAFMAIGLSSQAQVVHSGEQNLTLNFPDDSLAIDLDGDMVNDFALQMYSSSYSTVFGSSASNREFGWAILVNLKSDTYKNSWITELSTLLFSTYSTSDVEYIIPVVAGLELGGMIEPTEFSWGNATSVQIEGVLGGGSSFYFKNSYGTYSRSLEAGNFTGQEKFIGIRFYIGTDQHYGWIRVSLGDEADPLTLIDWAYEQTPGKAIQAGQGLGIDLPPAFGFSRVGTATDPNSTITLTASETISGFTVEDIVPINGTLSNFTVVTPGEIYTVEVAAMAEGKVALEIPSGAFTDAGGKENNIISFDWYYDLTGPVPTIESDIAYTRWPGEFINFEFDEPVSDLTADDLVVTNGTIEELYEGTQGRFFAVYIMANSEGQVTFEVPAGATTDKAGNPNLAASVSWIYDETNPEVYFSGVTGDVGEATQTITLSFSEEIQDFSMDILEINNGTASNLVEITPGLEYQIDITATDFGKVIVDIPEYTIFDLAGNPNYEVWINWNYVDITSVRSPLSEEISIFPNPAVDKLTIDLPEEATIRIVDLQGKTIHSMEQIRNETLDISSLEAGMYIVQVEILGEILIHKLVVE